MTLGGQITEIGEGVVSTAQTIIDSLYEHAHASPDRIAFRLLHEGEEECERLTYSGLVARTEELGGYLVKENLAGSKVLLLFGEGLDNIAAFLACLWAGATAVPCYSSSAGVSDGRIEAIISSCGPSVALACGAGLPRRTERLLEKRIAFVNTREIVDQGAAVSRPALNETALAFIQYTSGSISSPKGIQITHHNLMSNERMIQKCFGQSSASRIVTWLPLHHDMGLIGGVLQPVYSGAEAIVMTAGAFLQKPVRWLKAISQYRASTSGGPDFAYRHCVERIRDEELRNVDLSSWKVAFNGAEPVRASTLDGFSERFGKVGFDARAFRPCYGLAEATLLVSGKADSLLPERLSLDADALLKGQVVSSHGGDTRTKVLVSSGLPSCDCRVVIVAPDSTAVLGSDLVGEICVSGPNVAEQETRYAALESEPLANEGWLRTGDLGFLHNRELFVTGRIKELLIVRGQNHYPQDIEDTLGQAWPALRDSPRAAFATAVDDGFLIVVQEVPRRFELEIQILVDDGRAAVAERHGLTLGEIVFVRAGSIPRTSSGKIRRLTCRELFLSGAFRRLGRRDSDETAQVGRSPQAAVRPQYEKRLYPLEQIQDYLVTGVAQALSRPVHRVSQEVPFISHGLDSLGVMQLKASIERDLYARVPLECFFGRESISTLAALILNLQNEFQPVQAEPGNSMPGEPNLVSSEQMRMWYLQAAKPDSPALNIGAAVRIHGDLDGAALQMSLDATLSAHPTLRLRFVLGAKGPEAFVLQSQKQDLIDLGEGGRLAVDEVKDLLQNPFDLAEGPPIRFYLRKYSRNDHVLFVISHHIVTDAWSLNNLVRSVAARYKVGSDTAPQERLPERSLGITPSEALAARDSAYWRERLGSNAYAPALPKPGHPGAASSSMFSVSHQLTVDSTRSISSRAAAAGETLFSYCTAAFCQSLAELLEQEDLTIAVPLVEGGRARDERMGMIAYPALIPLHCLLGQDLAVIARKVGETVRGALEHPTVPLTEQLRMAGFERKSGFVSLPVLFSMFPPFARSVAVDGTRFALEDVVGGDQGVDLLAACQIREDRLFIRLQSRADAVDSDFFHHLATRFAGLLEGQPSQQVNLDVLAKAETVIQNVTERPPHRLIVAANFTASPLLGILQYWKGILEIPLDPAIAPAGQLHRQLLDPSSLLRGNRDGTNVVCLRRTDCLLPQQNSDGEPLDTSLIEAMKAAAASSRAAFLVLLLPDPPHQQDVSPIASNWQRDMAEALSVSPSMEVMTSDEVNDLYPSDNIHDAESDQIGDIPFTDRYFAVLSATIVRRVYGQCYRKLKLIVTDCDETLWGGRCGEDGWDGIVLNRDRLALQEYLLAQHNSGVLLAISSRNNPNDVWSVFEKRPEMRLRRSNFVAAEVNWGRKSDSIHSIARNLSIAPEAIAFMDDDPAECAEVRAHCHEVLVVELRGDAVGHLNYLKRFWPLDLVRATREGADRTKMYLAEVERASERKRVPSMAEFIQNLGLRCDIVAANEQDVPRIVELTHRTNQFNLNGKPRVPAEVIAWLKDSARELLVARVSDRFGEYGLVSFVSCLFRSGVMEVDTWVLSCRVLGRGVENLILESLGRRALSREAKEIDFAVDQTGRNQPVVEFLSQECDRSAAEGPLRVSSHHATRSMDRAVDAWNNPPAEERKVASRDPVPPAGKNQGIANSILSRIAEQLSSPSDILAGFSANQVKDPGPKPAARTEMENILAEIWEGLLHLHRPGLDQDFFEAGGTSVLAVRFLAEVKRRTSILIPVASFFTIDPTIKNLAALIDSMRVAESGDVTHAVASSVV